MNQPHNTSTAGPNVVDPNAAKPPKALHWPAFIVGLLALNVIVVGITVFAAVTNPAQVEPDYYERALNWDENRPDLND